MKTTKKDLLIWQELARNCKRYKAGDGICVMCVERLFLIIKELKGQK